MCPQDILVRVSTLSKAVQLMSNVLQQKVDEAIFSGLPKSAGEAGMYLACALLTCLRVGGTLGLVLAPSGLIPSVPESWG